MSAVPSIGRAARIESRQAAGAETTSDLFERFSGQIFGYCLHQLGSREEAEDAVQTTFMNAFRGLQRGIVPKVESAWLFKIAHNVCLSRRRSSFRRGRVEAPNNLEVLQEVVPAQEQPGDELMRLQDVLEQMPESQRRAILLREWQGLSYREIADELGLTQGAVETLIFRARRALAAGLEEEPAEPKRWGRRARHGFDAGSVLAAVKALLAGGVAKVAVTAAVVATSAAVVTSVQHHAVPPAHRSAVVVPARTAVKPAEPTTVAAATLFRVPAHPAAPAATRPQPAASKPQRTGAPKRNGAEREAPPALPPAVIAAPGQAVSAAAQPKARGAAKQAGAHAHPATPVRPEKAHGPKTSEHAPPPMQPSDAGKPDQHGHAASPGAKPPNPPGRGK